MPENLNVTATSTSMLLAKWDAGNNSLQVRLANLILLMGCYINTFRLGHLYISSGDACSVAGLLVNKEQPVKVTKLSFSFGHFFVG